MSDDTVAKFPLDEFASFEFKKSDESGRFVIVLRGDASYGQMIAERIGSLKFSENDLKKYRQ